MTAVWSGLAFGWLLAGAVVWAVVGSIAFGLAAAWLSSRLIRTIADVPSAIPLQFIGTFGVWILAEAVGISGILTMVVYAMAISRYSVGMPAAIRSPAYAVWKPSSLA